MSTRAMDSGFVSNTVTLQFSTTRWDSKEPGLAGMWKTLQLRWENKFSWVIRRMCHSPFSHVDFVLEDGSLLGASDMGSGSPCMRGNPRGVAIRPPDYLEFGYRRRMIIQTDKADAILGFAHSQIGKPFDKGALWEFVSPDFPDVRDWRDPGEWFCAELCICSFENGKYWNRSPFSWPKSRVSPTDHILVFINDPNFINYETFWEPIPGINLSRWET